VEERFERHYKAFCQKRTPTPGRKTVKSEEADWGEDSKKHKDRRHATETWGRHTTGRRGRKRSVLTATKKILVQRNSGQ